MVGVFYLYYGYGSFGNTHHCAMACNSNYPSSSICENSNNCTIQQFNDFINTQTKLDLNTWYCMGFLLSDVSL